MQGTIKNVNIEAGWGFIMGEDGKDYFFHRSALKNAKINDLEQGRDVSFEESESTRGLRAEDVYVEAQ